MKGIECEFGTKVSNIMSLFYLWGIVSDNHWRKICEWGESEVLSGKKVEWEKFMRRNKWECNFKDQQWRNYYHSNKTMETSYQGLWKWSHGHQLCNSCRDLWLIGHEHNGNVAFGCAMVCQMALEDTNEGCMILSNIWKGGKNWY